VVGAGPRPTAINGAISCGGGNGEGKRGVNEMKGWLFEGAWEVSRQRSSAAVRPEMQGGGATFGWRRQFGRGGRRSRFGPELGRVGCIGQ
jgi:hypothetical protein